MNCLHRTCISSANVFQSTPLSTLCSRNKLHCLRHLNVPEIYVIFEKTSYTVVRYTLLDLSIKTGSQLEGTCSKFYVVKCLVYGC